MNQPILGINSDHKNSVGFLCPIILDFNSIENYIIKLTEGDYDIVERRRARAFLYR